MTYLHKFKGRPNGRNYVGHTYRGSIIRHIAIEKAIDLLTIPTNKVPSWKLYLVIRIPYSLAYGLNCNFPLKDTVKYVALKHLRTPKPAT